MSSPSGPLHFRLTCSRRWHFHMFTSCEICETSQRLIFYELLGTFYFSHLNLVLNVHYENVLLLLSLIPITTKYNNISWQHSHISVWGPKMQLELQLLLAYHGPQPLDSVQISEWKVKVPYVASWLFDKRGKKPDMWRNVGFHVSRKERVEMMRQTMCRRCQYMQCRTCWHILYFSMFNLC